jgi:ABC-type bacteriocin/lantibiotic exporter with double-glycine peptidase domain
VLHKDIAVYFSEDEVFGGTLLENITVGKPDFDFEEVREVCEIVGLDDFIASRQEGLGVKLDPTGQKLSYNIAQKVLLARCLFMKPALLLLEDGWIGIEPESREKLLSFLTSPQNPCTVVAIGNDEHFASRFGRVITLKDGTIIQQADVS